jgi:putative beta-barrel porin BBP2
MIAIRLARVLVGLALAACVLSVSTRAEAQTQPPEAVETMPIHAGPVGLRPSLSVTNAGVDSNVFNSADHAEDDFTATIVPRIVARVRAGRLLFSYGAATDFVYFKEFKAEESVNFGSDVRLDANLGRLQPYVSTGWVSTKDRLNAELDARAPRTQRTIIGGTRMLVASKTTLVFNARRADLDFDQGAEFDGADLAHNLNSRADSVEGGVQVALTPLTTLNVTTSVQRDRFDSAPERNANTIRFTPSLQFDPTSLIRGTVLVGYRHFETLDPALADYSGVIVQVLAGYTLLERTKFDLDLSRDVQYSYEDLEPYYLSTGGRLTVTHQLVGPFDVQAFGGRQSLGYRSTGAAAESRTDRVETFGAGAGYRFHPQYRVGFTWEHNRRRSDLPDRRYQRDRLFASLTYGI